jgi:hypothetical protein
LPWTWSEGAGTPGLLDPSGEAGEKEDKEEGKEQQQQQQPPPRGGGEQSKVTDAALALTFLSVDLRVTGEGGWGEAQEGGAAAGRGRGATRGPTDMAREGETDKRRRRTSRSESPPPSAGCAGEEKEGAGGATTQGHWGVEGEGGAVYAPHVSQVERAVGLLDCTRLTLEACCRVIRHLRATDQLDQSRADATRYVKHHRRRAGHSVV